LFRPFRRLAGGLLLGLVVALVVLWPVYLWPRHFMVGHEGLDVWSHAWGMSWFVRSFVEGRLPWTVVGAAFPEERVLWYIDPIGALLTAPLQLFGPAVAYNGLCFLIVALAGTAGWWFGRQVGGRGWVAGVAIASTPFLQGELWNGVTEAAWLAPIALAGGLAATRSRWTGVGIGLAGIATPYHGVSAAFLAGMLLMMGGARGEGSLRERLVDLGRAAGISALLALPHYVGIVSSMATSKPFVQKALDDIYNLPVLSSNATDPKALIWPGDFWSRRSDPGVWSAAWRRTPYLGLGLLALAPLAFVRSRRLVGLLLPAGLLAVFCLGPFLWQNEAFVRTADGGFYKLPFAWVLEATRTALHHHMRFAAGAVVILAALADRGVGRAGLLLAPLILVEQLVYAPNSWPIYSSPALLPSVYAQLPDDGKAIIDLPGESGVAARASRYLYWQAIHGHPIPYVNHVNANGTASQNPALRTMALLSRREVGTPGSPGVPAADADIPAALAELVDEGFGYVILHTHLLRENDLERHMDTLVPLLGPPTVVEGGYLWRLNDEGA